MEEPSGNLLSDLEHKIARPELEKLPVEIAQVQEASRVVYYAEPRSASADRYRLLRMRLREVQAFSNIKRILITSPMPHDGKSTIVLNLATVLAERGKRAVLVIEGDLHRPTLSEYLGLNAGPGLADCLARPADPLSVIRRIEPLSWYLMTAGQAAQNPSELLQSENLPKTIERLNSLFDWIIIDSPPIAPLADTLSLARNADASLLVAKAGSTRRSAVEEAVAVLGRSRIVGIVLNGIESLDRYYSGYGYYN